MARRRGGDIDVSTGISIPKFVYDKIGKGVDLDIESRGLRPFRELLQNSDDARATTMTLRFDKDMLYVHNDGFTIEDRFVKAISEIFESKKENDPDTSGNFGSGFRSTYMFTDSPQMEWWDIEKDLICPSCDTAVGVSSTLSEIQEESGEPRYIRCKGCDEDSLMTDFEVAEPDSEGPNLSYRVYELPLGVDDKLDWKRIEDTHAKGYSTFDREHAEPVEGNTQLGVVFRFPWRRKNIWGRKAPGWSDYTWSNDNVKALANELREYAPIALIGCRHLTAIRIVMAGCAKKGERWDFVVTRDTTISNLKEAAASDHSNLPRMTIQHIAHERPDSFYDLDTKGAWKRTEESGHKWYDYTALHVEAENSPKATVWEYEAYSTYEKGSVDSVHSSTIKFWDFQVLLLPSFPDAPKLPVYTPIPLAGETPNHFGVIAMLPPTEDRLSIEVGGENQKEWLQGNITTASQNYRKALREHIRHLLQKLDAEELNPAEVERSIVNCLPRDAPNRWFGTGGGLVRIAKVEREDMSSNLPLNLISKAVGQLARSRVVLVGDQFLELGDTIHHWRDPEDGRIDEVLEILKAPRLSDNWGDFLSETKNNSAPIFYELVIEKYLLDNNESGSMSASKPSHFAKMVNDNWGKIQEHGDLSRLSEILVDGICTNLLHEDWGDWIDDLLKIQCIISDNGELRAIPDFIDTNTLPELVHILPPNQLIAADIRDETIEVISDSSVTGIADAIKPSGTRILKLIDQDTRINPEVHDDLESHEEVHKAVSMLLRAAFDKKYKVRNNLNDDAVRKLRYVPCRRHGRVVTLQNNIVDLDGSSFQPGTWKFGKLSSSNLTMSSLYHREFIFAKRTSALDALPSCITDRLRFLALHKDVTPNLVSKDVLNLNGVGDGAKMTNLVRTLLFEHELASCGLAATQPSLFRQDELEKWLQQPPMHLGTAESASEERDLEYDLEEVKRKLIVSLLSPYGDTISGGLGVKGARDSVELVLGADGKWRTGNSYCLTLDPSLDNLIDNMAAVDENFASSLSEGVLKQLGVHDSLGPHAAKPAIESRIDDENALALLMISLLSREEDWMKSGNDNDEVAWRQLCRMAWIPTNGAGVLQPNQVLYPSEDQVALLGEAYTHFPPKSTWETLRQANHKERARNLGMRFGKVDLGVLILAICGEHTSGNDVSVAVKELSSRLLQSEGMRRWGGLKWGPHDSVPGLKLRLKNNSTINSQDGVWVTENSHKAQTLKLLFNDMEVVAIDQLSHIDHSTIKGIRKLGIFQAGPEWPEILKRLTEVDTPELVEGLWKLLLEYEEAPEWRQRTGHENLFDGESDVNFCLDGEVVVIHERILITNNPDEHSQAELDGRIRCYVGDRSIGEQWFGLLGVEQSSRVNPGDTLRSIVGEVIDLSDDAQAARLIAAKSLMALCEDGRNFAPIWADGGVEIVDLGESLAIHPGPDSNAIHQKFRTFPIIHSADNDPVAYINWLDNLRHHNLTPFSDISSTSPEPVMENYRVHPPLQDAIKQVMQALSMIHRQVFYDPARAKVTCRIGSGGVPSYMTAKWEGEKIKIQHSSSKSGCFYGKEEDELTMFVDEDDDHGNERSCSNELVEGLLKIDWYPKLSDRISQDDGFSSRLKNLIRNLLETPTDEWKYLELDGINYGPMLKDVEWHAHSRLFESHSQSEMTQLLKGWYGGCQICGLVTPASEYGEETKESLIQTIRIRGSPYYGLTDQSRPKGRQLWLCPRHRILWERRLVRFNCMDDAFDGKYTWRGTLPAKLKEEGIGLLKDMRDNWEEGYDMEVKVFDQTVGDFAQDINPQWNSNSMRVKKEHAKAILNEMIGWISS